MTLRILDLFCGAGGAAVGYSYFPDVSITGVDINPQPHYPFHFIQADVLNLPASLSLDQFDFIHASPPCQGYSLTRNLNQGRGLVVTPRIVPEVRELIKHRPYVMENVMHAPLNDDSIMLCGSMFPNTPTYRHRLFESNLALPIPPVHTPHSQLTFKPIQIQGHDFRLKDAVDALQIDWMTIEEIAEAIPPMYTKFVAFGVLPQLIQQAVPA